MTIREQLEELEKKFLSPLATLSSESKGRLRSEPECPIRSVFQRDRDRIIHSKSFRRLKHKTQVFLAPTGDHYRTRLTHVIEVSQIARTISKALRLNEDLTEAIALGHDLGHTPFGHAGETVLNDIYPGGFKHVIHSLRVVDVLEKNGQGLNLTYEVRDGVAKHSKGMGPVDNNPQYTPETMEGQVVRLSDLVAYANHDLDDAIRADIITIEDVPKECIKVLGKNYSERVNKMVTDIISETIKLGEKRVVMSPEVEETIWELRGYLYENVYMNEKIWRNFIKASKIVRELYEYFCSNPEEFWKISERPPNSEPIERAVCDFIAGMTDLYAITIYEKIFLPRRWQGDLSTL